MDFNLKANALGLVLKTIGIEPTLDGLLTAFGFKPADVYDAAELAQAKAPVLIAWAQKEAPALIKKIEGDHDRLVRIEALNLAIAHKLGIREINGQSLPVTVTPHPENDRHVQLPDYVEKALLDAAGA